MSPWKVIRSAMDKRRAAAHGGCFIQGQDDVDACADGTCACARTLDRDADAILAALSAAPEAVRLELARQLAGDAHRVVPVEPTEAMWARCAHICCAAPTSSFMEHAREGYRAMLAAAQEDQR